jgi:hypothetical protein
MLIYELMGKVMADIGPIAKAQTNEQQGWKFRGIDDVYNAIHEAMKKYGVFCLPKVKGFVYREPVESYKKTKGWDQILEMEYRFCAPDGSFVECTSYGEACDFGSDKITNKCMSIADKYALFQIFKIPTKDLLDPDKDHPLDADAKQRQQQQRQQHQQQRQQQYQQRQQQQQQQNKQRPDGQNAKQLAPQDQPNSKSSQVELIENHKKEMISLIENDQIIDWIKATNKTKQQVIAVIASETDPEILKKRWKTLQKILFEEPINENPLPQNVEEEKKG